MDPFPFPPEGLPPEGTLEVLGTDQAARWMDVLRASVGHDFCHLPQYHRVAEQQGDGVARLFAWRDAGITVAMPLLIRPIDPSAPGGWQDASSVYGYGGPIASREEVPEPVAGRFREALRSALAGQKVVTAFSRMHPLLHQRSLLTGLGELKVRGLTVSIDTTPPEKVQLASYTKRCRASIRKLHEAGFQGVLDEEKRHLGDFISIYHETMERVGASRTYFFDRSYFEALAEALGPALHLFLVHQNGTIAAASLATLCGGIMQDFLGGTRGDFLKVSPDRLIVDTERRFAQGMGARTLHLGGGVGLQEDSVFRYKARFSDRRHTFYTWQCVLLPEVYAALCAEKASRDAGAGLAAVDAEFFPAYRCPSRPAAPDSSTGAE